MRRPQVTRLALLVLCGYCLFIGFVAVAAPHAFYDDFRQIGDAEVAKLFDAARQSRTITVVCQRGVTGGGSSE